MVQDPMKSKLIAPSLLSCDFSRIASEIDKITQAGADWLHVDVMDGHFVPNITIGPVVVESIKRASPLPLDVHLMIDHPERFIPAFVKAGADLLTVHVEATKDPRQLLQMIKNMDVRAGITLRPGTDIADIEPFLDLVDLVLIMTVEPGFGGQSFMENQIPKLKRIRRLIDDSYPNVLLEVDGGINEETVHLVKEADVLVAGSYIFKNDYAQTIARLRKG